jgi:hypothetical protein
MQRQPVQSNVLASIAYEREVNVLEVEFHTGRIYQYFMVPAAVHEELLTAPSMGEYFNRRVRSAYRCVEVTGAARK